MKKYRILALNLYYLPGYKGGGSIRALSNMVDHLKSDFEFVVVTASHDLLDPNPYSDQEKISTVNREGYKIIYLNKNSMSFFQLIKILSEKWDLIYLNSSFSLKYSILPIFLHRLFGSRDVPILLAPRGELMAGALSSKFIKKNFFLSVARFFGHFRGLTFHATSEQEAAEINALSLGNSKVILAPDLPPIDVADVTLSTTKKKEFLSIIFISRIDPKKNLLFALEVLENVKVSVVMDIVGPISDSDYWQLCKNRIEKLPKHISVNYLGSKPHKEIIKTFASYDAFFFPTLAENNGYVILEALLAGCPVLLSDRTPWRGLAELGIGWDISLEQPDDFSLAVEKLFAHTPEMHLEMRARAQIFGRSRLLASDDISATRTMLMKVME